MAASLAQRDGSRKRGIRLGSLAQPIKKARLEWGGQAGSSAAPERASPGRRVKGPQKVKIWDVLRFSHVALNRYQEKVYILCAD